MASRFDLRAADGHQIHVDLWQPTSDTKLVGVIQILHGLGEHTGRYGRFAQCCVTKGFAVAAHSHRGHGTRCPPELMGHYADTDGWNKVVGDALRVRQKLLDQYSGAPLIVLGHSKGSYVAQCSVMRDSEGVAALILSASTYASRPQLTFGRLYAALEIWRHGGRNKSARLNETGFGDFNKRFVPNRSEFDWLSRDNDEVDKYIADPACGGLFSNRLWFDLLGGLQEITRKKALQRVPVDLPILIMGGQQDPIGGQSGLTTLAKNYRDTEHSHVTLCIYEGGRHEMLNETNRDEVTADILRWSQDQVVAPAR